MSNGSFRRDCRAACDGLPAGELGDCLDDCDDVYEALDNAFITPDSYSTNDIVTLPSSDVKIEFHYEDKLKSHFIITDTQGTKYYFGQTDGSREKTANNFKDNFNNDEYQDKNEREFISTWHLDKIEYPNLPADEGITFTYITNTITTETVNRMVPASSDLNLYADCMEDKNSGENCDDCMDFNGEVDNPHSEGSSAYDKIDKHNKYYHNNFVTQRSTIETKLISRIGFTKGYIKFDYNGGRNDLENGKSLAKVSIGEGSSIVSTTELDHSFFSSSDSYFKGAPLGLSYVPLKGYRLKLDGVIRDGIPVSEFEYINDTYFHPDGSDMYELPPRDSYYTDHWGYYNGGPHQGAMYTWHGPAEVDGTTFPGIDKSISEYAKANMLTKVIYPTGGYKEFYYGIHGEHGGVRVDSIKIFDGNGQTVSDMSYTYLDEYNPLDFEYVADHIVTVPEDRNEVVGEQIPHIFESSHTLVFDLNGPTNGYRTVEEHNVTSGAKSVHEFIRTGDMDRDIQYATKSYAIVDTYRDTFDDYTARPVLNEEGTSIIDYEALDDNAFPYATPTLLYFDRGIEKKVTNYDKAGKKLSEVENHFLHDALADFSVSNHSFHLEYLDENAGIFADNSLEFWYVISKYDITTRNLKLDYSISRTYDDTGLGNLISETRTDYGYSNEFETLPTLVESETTIDGQVIQGTKSRTYYPFEKNDITIVEDPTVLDEMVNINMIAVPIQSESKVLLPGETAYKFSGNSLTTFKNENAMILPFESHVAILPELKNADYEFQPDDFEVTSTVSYDDQGWVTSRTGQDGIVTSYIYDSRGHVTSMTVDPGVESLKRTTSYEYYRLGRLKKVTDPNGKEMSYVYDDQNRLLLTKDHFGSILKRYRYNTVGESNSGLSVEIQGNAGYNLTNSPITLKAHLTGSTYGSPQFVWKDDDSSTAFATYTYANEGTYNIDVTVTDLDHPDLTTSDNYPLTVFDNIADLTISGPTSVEYCHDHGTEEFLQDDDGGNNVETETGTFYSGSSQFTYGFGYGARCYEGYEFVMYEYKRPGIDWTRFGDVGQTVVELPLTAFDEHATENYTIDVKVTVKDLCSNQELKKERSIQVVACGSGGLGGPDDGTGGGASWSLSISPAAAELCPDGSPSSVNVSATPGELPSCSSGFTYTWEYKEVGASSWSPITASNDQSAVSLSRSFLTGGTTTYGAWDVKVTVSDGCGGTNVKTARVSILANCDDGDGIQD
ncbi:RHS repeat domain-containing protein [Ekhidna sp.]